MSTTEHLRRTSRGASSALMAGLTTALLWNAPAGADTAMANRIDEVVDRWVSAEKIVGLSAVVARDGEVVYRRVAGHADREAAREVTGDTLFRLVSMTKALTSATALALVEEGKLSLDDTVAEWLPYFTPRLADGREPDITIRQLMSHTPGLSYPFDEEAADAFARANAPVGLERSETTLEGAMRKLAAVPLFYEPGTEWRYSVSIDVLGAVIEQASGMSLPEAIERYVTGPLGMRETSFVAVDPERLAMAYRDGPERALRLDHESDMTPLGVEVSPARALDASAWPSGGGGMSGSVSDYLRFLESIRTGGAPILSAESVELFTMTVLVLTNTSVAGVIGEFPAEIRDAVYGHRSFEG